MAIKLLGFPNSIRATSCLLTSPGPVPVGYELTYLKSEEPSETTRITTVDPLYTWIEADFLSGTPPTMDGIAIVNGNLTAGGLFRFSNNEGGYTALSTTVLSDSQNCTGLASDVDEAISSPDGLFMTPTNTSIEWFARLGFSGPGTNPPEGIGNGVIVVNVRLVGNPTIYYPKLTVDLYQSGVFIAALGWRAVADTNNQTFVFPFDPAVFTNESGTSLSAKLSFTNGSSGAYAKLDTVRCYVENTLPLLTSGWLECPLSMERRPAREFLPTLSYSNFPSPSWPVGNLEYWVLDDGVTHDPDPGSGSGINIYSIGRPIAQGYIEAGVWVAGRTITFTPGLTIEDSEVVSIKIEDVGGGNTLGGQSYAASSWKRRRTEPLSLQCTREEADLFMYTVPWARGHSGAFYLTLDPAPDLKFQTFQSFWATLVGDVERKQLKGQYAADGSALFVITCQFEEKI